MHFCVFSQEQLTVRPDNKWKTIDSLRKNISSSPDSLSYHKAYLKAIGWVSGLYWHAEEFKSRFDSVENEMMAQYEIWLKKFPRSATVHEALGTAYYESESPKATAYLKKAVELNPKNAELYLKLAIDAERWGNQKAAEEFMRLASITDTENPAYSFYYAMYFDEKDLGVFDQKIHSLVNKFPGHERAAQGLYWLGNSYKDRQEKKRIYLELREKFPPEKSSWSSSGMYALYDLYLFEKNYLAAIELAESLKAKKEWSDYLSFANGLFKIQHLIDGQFYKQAYDSMVKLKSVRYSKFLSKTALLEAELAEKTGNTTAAYTKLLELVAKNPSDDLLEGLATYSNKLKKDNDAVNEEIWAIRSKTTKPAYPFDLGLYTAKKNAKLSDYKGKVILLTFWFPGCGPCRAEFPHFENVVKKFKGKDLVYLGINVFPNQDSYVLPFLKGTKYSFIPLRATNPWAEKHYGVKGQPTNFLIGRDGNIVYSNFRTDQENERSLELMIASLLDK